MLQGCDLSSRVAQLHATLETLKRESEQKIIKLKAENEEATRYKQFSESWGTVPLQLPSNRVISSPFCAQNIFFTKLCEDTPYFFPSR